MTNYHDDILDNKHITNIYLIFLKWINFNFDS